jgi:hypothetical protein
MTYNISIITAKGESFRVRFTETAILSLSVAVFSFGIGYIIRLWLEVNI